MNLKILWEHHCFDGIPENIFKYGFYEFNLKVRKKRNIFKMLINKIQKKNIEKTFFLDIPQENFDILYNIFNKTNDFFTEFLIFCPKENLQHFGYFYIKKNKEAVFFPVSRVTDEEFIRRNKLSNSIM